MYLRDRSASGRRSICKLLVKYFSSVFVNEQLEEPDEVQVNDILIFMQIDEQELMHALYNIDDNVKSGPDGIPPYFVKRHRFSLLKPLLKLFYNSSCRGIILKLWKTSFVFPIFKEGNKNDASNYRPVSILCTTLPTFLSQ